MREEPYTHHAFDRPEWSAAGARRAHPQDAPEQCFDAERYGSPYFHLMVRADICDGRGIEVSAHQGSAVGNPGYRLILPVQRLDLSPVAKMQGADALENLLRAFRWEVTRYSGQFGTRVESTVEHASGKLIREFRERFKR
jgi:hypothetical protein